MDGSIDFELYDESDDKIKVYVLTEQLNLEDQKKFWGELPRVMARNNVISVPFFGSGGFSAICIPTKIKILLRFSQAKNTDVILKTTLKVSDILSTLMPFPAYCDIPERIKCTEKSWSYGGPLNIETIETMKNIKVEDLYPEDYLLSNDKLFLITERLKDRQYLYSSLRLSKESKKAIFQNDVSKSIAFIVSAIENFYEYEDDKNIKRDSELLKILNNLKNKTEKFKEFLKNYLNKIDLSKLPEIDKWYSRRSSYLHNGEFLEFPDFWINLEEQKLKAKNEEYNKYFVGLQIIFKALQNYFLNRRERV